MPSAFLHRLTWAAGCVIAPVVTSACSQWRALGAAGARLVHLAQSAAAVLPLLVAPPPHCWCRSSARTAAAHLTQQRQTSSSEKYQLLAASVSERITWPDEPSHPSGKCGRTHRRVTLCSDVRRPPVTVESQCVSLWQVMLLLYVESSRWRPKVRFNVGPNGPCEAFQLREAWMFVYHLHHSNIGLFVFLCWIWLCLVRAACCRITKCAR